MLAQEVYRRSPAVDETTVGERVVLYHRVTGCAVVLNPTASLLWGELAAEAPADSLVASIADRFPDVERAQIANDVDLCIRELIGHKLVSAKSAVE